MGDGGRGGGSKIVSPEFRHSLNMVKRWSDEEKTKQEAGNIEGEDFNRSSASR